jgi:cytochrome c6
MSKTIGICAVAIALMTSSLGFAQGADVYKTKCQSCHGATGTPNPAMAKAMGVKPASDPSVKAHSAAQMITITTDGKGKMPAFKGKMNDDQIKESVEYFRSLAK